HFGMLHDKNLTPHRAVWTLATITAVIGVLSIILCFGDAAAPTDATIQALPHGLLSSVGYMSHATMAALPNSLLMATLTSNFGTFILYALSCLLCIIAFHGRSDFNFVKHLLIPAFGLLANLGCMAFYLIGPTMGYGTVKEPLGALLIAAVWGLYGAFYFMRSSKAKGKGILLQSKQGQVMASAESIK
ncbi:MAG: hypothetical protein ACYCPM_01145, partial [Acidobacteriaceae bacterium]